MGTSMSENITIRYDEEGSTNESFICHLRNDNQGSKVKALNIWIW